MEAYCVKCKTKREMKDIQPVFTKNGTPAVKGVCVVCGTSMFRMGRTELHEGMEPPKKQPKPRKGNLVIVESPAKARTVGRLLGKDYKVMASVGHVRDLLRSQLSVDVENDFTPKYRVPNEKRPIVKQLKAEAKKAANVFLATDPDREGEAIAWHLMEAVEIDPEITHRVVFHEITEPAVTSAFSNSRDINMNLVDAQQARRILDRLVGYSLSPLLWRKVRSRLSAGRVQSVALRLIVEREREIEVFVPEEYWSIEAELQPDDNEKQIFIAKLSRIDDQEVKLSKEEEVKPILIDMESAKYVISKVKIGTRKRKPAAPFTTSTLQQDASRRLSFTARKTMRVAQQLYEGIELDGKGTSGLITYMRTDSTNISEIAQKEARQYIGERHGKNFLPEKPPVYKTKARRAQEAHEAIRPTSVFRTPQSLKKFLSRDQYRLYQLIWRRFVASQMAAAIYDTVTIEVLGKTDEHQYQLRASGLTMHFQGFTIVYQEAKGGDKKNGEETNQRIPTALTSGQLLDLIRLIPAQHFTQPPPRYSEASLVKTMEEYGIGRPSTYAPILGTIQQRGYVEKDGRRLFPTETGIIVNDLLVEYFPDVLNVEFTAQMENDLDRIAAGDIPWVECIREFYQPFSKQVKIAEAEIPELKIENEPVGRQCPECGHDLVIRWGRYGKFISCSNFPTCRYTEPYLEKIGVKCPKDSGDIVMRKTRKGRIFYGCSNYPTCDFTSWKRPLPQPCPNCGGLLVEASKKEAQCIVCEQRFPLNELKMEQLEKSESA